MEAKSYHFITKKAIKIEDFLNSSDKQNDSYELMEIVLDTVLVLEKVVKNCLFEINPLLPFEGTIYNDRKVSSTVLGVLSNNFATLKTIEVKLAIDTYERLSEKQSYFYTKDEKDAESAIDVLIETRNQIVHGVFDKNLESEYDKYISAIGIVWQKTKPLLLRFVDGKKLKTEKITKKYSQKEVDDLLEEQVKAKIRFNQNRNNNFAFFDANLVVNPKRYNYPFLQDNLADVYVNRFTTDKQCPRCSMYGFSRSNNFFEDLWKCQHCNLELTEKEFLIACKLME